MTSPFVGNNLRWRGSRRTHPVQPARGDADIAVAEDAAFHPGIFPQTARPADRFRPFIRDVVSIQTGEFASAVGLRAADQVSGRAPVVHIATSPVPYVEEFASRWRLAMAISTRYSRGWMIPCSRAGTRSASAVTNIAWDRNIDLEIITLKVESGTCGPRRGCLPDMPVSVSISSPAGTDGPTTRLLHTQQTHGPGYSKGIFAILSRRRP